MSFMCYKQFQFSLALLQCGFLHCCSFAAISCQYQLSYFEYVSEQFELLYVDVSMDGVCLLFMLNG